MIEIAGVEFPLTFVPQIARRELVLLGVVPLGAIDRLATGRWCWSLDLPVVRQMRGAATREEACERVRHIITDWLQAAASSQDTSVAPARHARAPA